MRNVLITGGRGGLGRGITRVLAASASTRVITFSRNAPQEGPIPLENILHETGSILDEERLTTHLRNHRITHVIHAAGARTRACQESPQVAHEVNVVGTASVLNAVRRCSSVQSFLFLSSAAVYGHTTAAVDETQPLNPATTYARTKAEAETLVRRFAEDSSVPTCIVRPGFVAGPEAEGGLSTFLRSIGQSEAARLVFPKRFHIHDLDDLARSLVQLLDVSTSEKVEVFHLPGVDASLEELRTAIAHVLPRQRIPEDTIEVEPAALLPERLDWRRYRERFGSGDPMALAELIRRILPPPP